MTLFDLCHKGNKKNMSFCLSFAFLTLKIILYVNIFLHLQIVILNNITINQNKKTFTL